MDKKKLERMLTKSWKKVLHDHYSNLIGVAIENDMVINDVLEATNRLSGNKLENKYPMVAELEAFKNALWDFWNELAEEITGDSESLYEKKLSKHFSD